MKIGMLVAIETDAIFDYYEAVETVEERKGFTVYKVKRGNNEIYIAHMGMGEIASSSGTQHLISKYGVDMIANFGVVGGLTEQIKKNRVCAVERVVHYKYDCSEFMDLKVGQVDGHDSIFIKPDETLVNKACEICPELKRVTCCSGDKFIATPEEKSYLHETFEGDICEMEAAGIVLTCEANNVPCLLLKAVSDSLFGGAREFYEELSDAAKQCLEVLDKVMLML